MVSVLDLVARGQGSMSNRATLAALDDRGLIVQAPKGIDSSITGAGIKALDAAKKKARRASKAKKAKPKGKKK